MSCLRLFLGKVYPLDRALKPIHNFEVVVYCGFRIIPAELQVFYKQWLHVH